MNKKSLFHVADPSRRLSTMSVRKRFTQAFTLFELLVVMSIMLLIAAIAIPNIGGLGSTAKYAQATSGIVDTMHIARQMAIVNNQIVQVRFYEMDAELGGETFFTAVGVVIPGSGEETERTEGDLMQLPDAIVMDPDFSNMLNSGIMPITGTDDGNLWKQTDGKNYTGFEYLPDGTANLDQAKLGAEDVVYHVTIRELKDLKKQDSENLANFATIRIEPQSGRAQIYRPGV